MAIKIVLLVVLFAAITATLEAAAPPAVPLPAEWTAANKSISGMHKATTEAFDSVLAAAGPDEAKKEQAQKAIFKHMLIIGIVLAMAKETGDEKKVISTARSYELASTMVIIAPPAEKLRVMDDTFYAVAVPAECPSSVVADKPYCETVSKIEKASGEVISAAPREKTEQVAAAVAELRYRTDMTMNKAYVEDHKRFPEVLAAYTKASDAVIAAAPAQKLKVMEKAFTATAQARRAGGAA